MAKMYRKRSRKGRKMGRKVRRGGKRTPIKKLIKREIARNVETKSRQVSNLGIQLYGPAVGGTFDATNVIPLSPTTGAADIQQGTGEGQRVGNRIKLRKVMFRGTLVPAPYHAVNNTLPKPVQVKMFLFYDKTVPSNVPTPAVNGDFFQFNSTTIGIYDDLVSMWAPVNTDRYTVLATKTFKLGWSSFTGTGANPGPQYYSNNDFKMNANFSWNVTKHCVKNVIYRDNNINAATRCLSVMILPVWADGNPMGNQQPCGLQYILDTRYEDA